MTSSVKVLTTASLDSSPTLILIAPNGSRILIDCGEGCQRACLEYGQRLSTVESLCLTSLQVTSTGGLPGLLLTVADVHQMVAATSAAKQKAATPRNHTATTTSPMEDDVAMEETQGNGVTANKKLEASQSTINTNSNNNHNNITNNRRSLWPFRHVDDTNTHNNSYGVQTLKIIGPVGTRAYIQSLRHFIRRKQFPVLVREGSSQGELNACQEEDRAAGDHDASATSTNNGSSKKGKKKRKKSKAPQENDPQKVCFSYQSIAFDEECDSDTDTNSGETTSRKRPRTQQEQQQHYTNSDEQFSHNDKTTATTSPPSTNFRNSWISYLFTTPPLPGKFLIEKAQELGVPRGPLYGKLKAGHSVTFEKKSNGDASDPVQVTVHSADVVMPPQPGIGVLVLRYPAKASSLERFWQQMDLEKLLLQQHAIRLEVVIHIASWEVFEHSTSMEWRTKVQSKMPREGERVEQIWVDTDPTFDTYGTPHLSAAQTARMRNMVCPAIYQVPLRQQTLHNRTFQQEQVVPVAAFPSMEYQLLPRSKRGYQPPIPPGLLEVTAERIRSDESNLLNEVERSGAIQLAHQIQSSLSYSESGGSAPDEGRIIFTGTASAIPCKHRNVSGICLLSNDDRAILLDVGEGTVGQLLRTTTWISKQEMPIDVGRSLSRIKAVWISHPHADHHLGLLRLLHERQCRDDPLLIIGPQPIFEFLREYECVHPSIAGRYRGIDCRDFTSPNPAGNNLLSQAIGTTNCRAVRVTHCPFSYAIILDGTSFGRLVYSGDCRPCDYLAKVAHGADVLIHEATFEDGMEAEAAVKRHCTVGEALKIARQMQAKNTILTHFSQRYPKIPPIPEADRSIDGQDKNHNPPTPIVFAFDFMTLSKTNIHLASKLTEALRLLYPPEGEDATDDEQGENELLEKGLQMAKDAMSIPGLFAQDGLL